MKRMGLRIEVGVADNGFNVAGNFVNAPAIPTSQRTARSPTTRRQRSQPPLNRCANRRDRNQRDPFLSAQQNRRSCPRDHEGRRRVRKFPVDMGFGRKRPALSATHAKPHECLPEPTTWVLVAFPTHSRCSRSKDQPDGVFVIEWLEANRWGESLQRKVSRAKVHPLRSALGGPMKPATARVESVPQASQYLDGARSSEARVTLGD